MRARFAMPRVLAAALACALAVGVFVSPAMARSKKLRPPPDVDLDPDRGMSFGRLSKNPIDRSLRRRGSALLPSAVMDASHDPYSPLVKPSRYDPQTGEIRGGVSTKLQEMRRREEQGRPARPASPAGFYKTTKQFTPGGQLIRQSTQPPGSRRSAGTTPPRPIVSED